MNKPNIQTTKQVVPMLYGYSYSIVLNEDDITTNLLVDKVHELYFNRQKYVEAIGRSHQMDMIREIFGFTISWGAIN